MSLQGSRLAIPREPGYQTIEQPLFSARLLTGPRCTEMIGSGTGDCAPAPSHTTGRTVFRIRRLDPAAVPTRRKTGRPPTIDRLPCLVHRFLSGWTQHLPWLPPASARHGSTASASACSPFRSPSQGKDLPARDSGKPRGHCISRSSSLAPWSFGPSLQRHYPPSSLLWPLLTSPPLSPRSPPQVRCCFFPFIPSGSTSHVSDGHGASLWPASLPPVRGLSADSCSYGQRFVPRFLRLGRAACAPRLPLCGSLRLPPSVPVSTLQLTRNSPCWAHWRKLSACRVSILRDSGWQVTEQRLLVEDLRTEESVLGKPPGGLRHKVGPALLRFLRLHQPDVANDLGEVDHQGVSSTTLGLLSNGWDPLEDNTLFRRSGAKEAPLDPTRLV